MRIPLSHLVALLPLLIAGCSRPEAPSELHWRFAGSSSLRAQTNAPVLAESLTLPQADAVVAPLANRLAEAWWHVGTAGRPLPPSGMPASSILIPELLRNASVGEVFLTPGGLHEFAVAIHGFAGEPSVWEKQWISMTDAMHAARGSGGKAQTLRQDGWLIAVSDGAVLPPASAWKRLQAYAAEPGALVQFDVRYPGRAGIKASMTARDGFARWTATATLAKPLPPALPAWQLPSGIREPLVLFTALRGVPALAGSLPFLKAWSGRTVPSELFVWGQPGMPENGHTYLAARMDDPKATVVELSQRLTPLFTPTNASHFRGNLNFEPGVPRVTVSGSLPVLPTFEALTEGNRGYLTFGFIPPVRATNALAPEMIAQLNRTNLLYYDWEITANAVRHWHLIGQLHDLLGGRHAVVSTPATQWMHAIAPKLGETVTEGLVIGPNSITVRRKSSLGLSGIELAALAKWIDPTPPFRRILPSATNAPGTAAKKRKSP